MGGRQGLACESNFVPDIIAVDSEPNPGLGATSVVGWVEHRALKSYMRNEAPSSIIRMRSEVTQILMSVCSRKNALVAMPGFFPEEGASFSQVIDDPTLRQIESIVSVTREMNVEGLSEERFSEIVKRFRAEIVVTGWGSPKLTLEVYKQNPQLRYMCHTAGTVRPYVDKEVMEAGLIVTNWGNAVARSVAEGALMMILAGLRRVTSQYSEMRLRRGWRTAPQRTEGLFHQRVGLHGFGAIARELTRLLEPFSCNISAFSPHVQDEVFEEYQVRRVDCLEELFVANRIVCVHAAYTADNYHVINQNILSRLENGGLIVNTARGAIIDEAALIRELKTGRISAALDVFEEEPLPGNSPLRELENCLLTPHAAGPTSDRMKDMGQTALRNIKHYIANEPLEHLVTPYQYGLMT